ncbi:DUF4920 domain-containing protein [Flavobacterium sp.]|uniref:DUF4920 domain-containing protein n=1 Tax=Flavobacterium sp. TaxID=239 RepID=UPI003529B08B
MKKNILLAFTIASFAIACKDSKTENSNNEVTGNKVEYATFGATITDADALTEAEMLDKYKSLKEGDTITVKFKSNINNVCQKKGCWMTLDLGNEQESFVKFKDYAFFVPMNAQENQSIVEGKAFVSVISVDDLKHYAKDEGKSQAAIDSITEPEVTYGFLADGVLIAKQ